MDDFTFDAVARAVATGASRRQALRLLAGSVLAAWFPQRAWAAPARQDDACEPGLTYCPGAMGSFVCVVGDCVCGDLIYCPPRSDGQPEGCYDLLSDYFHCGSCDVSCPSASPGPVACIGGECVATGCIEGLTDCTGNLDCVDLSADPFNCGGCGTVCDSGVCEGGFCTQVGCPAGSWDCDGNGICVSLLDDPNHCGTCGTVCASGVCEGGFCATLGCAPGLVACPYSVNLGPAGCYDLATDRNRCGSCDNYCWQVGSTTQRECIEGTCVETGCLEGLTDCTGNLDCVDLGYDANNCGACGNVCASGVCNEGVCAGDTTCAAGLAYCPAREITIGFAGEPYELAAGCYDLFSDRNHCGSCDITCPTTVGCHGGECRLPTCEAGRDRCDGVGCVDLLSDPAHCGGCDIVCAADEVCEGGVCGLDTTCAAGLTYCPEPSTSGGQPEGCYDLSSDYYRCGSCDTSCPIASPGPMACIAGQCEKHCDPPRTLCTNPASIHPDYCADLSSDPQNCGTCTTACVAGEVCEAGKCTSTTPATRDAASSTTSTQDAANGASERPQRAPRDRTDRGTTAASGATNRDNGGSTAGERKIQGAGADDPASVLVWPFDAKAGQWTIVHGYRAVDEDTNNVATPSADRGDFARLALEFAVCPAADVDAADGTCDLGATGSNPSWDWEATQGSTIASPVDGTVAWTDGDASCLTVGIDIAGHAGYRLALYNVEGDLKRGQRMKHGKRIGKVPTRGCERGDRLRMALYQPQKGTSDDPVAARQGVPFTGEWAIAGCEYPDDKRTVEQYRGELVPCKPEEEVSANS
ncbi:MAG: Tryptophan synthase alpha chain [Thermomicrobiales bacterium]|nr:Tryptophan synthase alpha chain [Thermomicrobiales bacterium]